MTGKVLIIEDDAALRGSIVQTLELEGLEPIATASFTQARRSIRANFRGIILSDIKMPGQDGFHVLDFVKARDAELPVILLTGHSDVPTAMRAMKKGAYDYLEKPCDPDRLIETLRRALDHRMLVLENRALNDRLEGKAADQDSGSLAERMESHERQIIVQALSVEGGKVAMAAQRLGMARNTLYDRMSRLGIDASAVRKARPKGDE